MRECVSYDTVQPVYVADGGGELQNVVQMTGLTQRVSIGAGIECVHQGFVVCKHVKVLAFQ